MIEDILAILRAEGFRVSNTFQLESTPSAFGPADEWQVYLRNERNTRTGNGRGEGMEAALRAAYEAAMKGPTFVNDRRNEAAAPKAKPAPAFRSSPTVPVLGDGDETDAEELF